MNRRWILPAALVTLAGAAAVGTRHAWSAPESAAWNADAVHSFVLFKVKHMGASWSYGRFNDFTFTLNAGPAQVDAVTFEVKAESIDTGNEKRDQHLRSPDFLNAKQFPTISFKSTAVKAVDAETTEVTGDLTLHGVTKPVTAKVVKVGTGKGRGGEDLVGYEGVFTVKRADFGITYGPGAVGDDITMTVAIEASKK